MTPRFQWSPGPAAWQDDVSPLPPSEWNYDRAAHLLAHAGFGGTPEEIEKLADAGLDRAFEAGISQLLDFFRRAAEARMREQVCGAVVVPLRRRQRRNVVLPRSGSRGPLKARSHRSPPQGVASFSARCALIMPSVSNGWPSTVVASAPSHSLIKVAYTRRKSIVL